MVFDGKRLRRLILAVLFLGVLAIVGGELYVASHRTLYIVNGFGQPVDVRLDDELSLTVPPHEVRTATIHEGTHRATVAAPGLPKQDVDFTVESDLIARLTESPVYVLNADGAAVIVREEAVYSDQLGGGKQTTAYEWHIGRPFLVFNHVDYAFQDFPPSLPKESQPVRKSRVAMETFDPTMVLPAAPPSVTVGDKLNFAEAHLRMDGGNWALLTAYGQICAAYQQEERCRRFLEAGLNRVPVNVNWHRAYQTVRERSGDVADLVAEYQQRLDKDPGNAVWLYLRGRIEPDFDKAFALFNRACDADPKSPYPWFAKAYRWASRGEFVSARNACERACTEAPDDVQMREMRYRLRLACGDAAEVEAELRAEMNREPPSSLVIPIKLWETLAVEQKRSALQESYDAFRARLSRAASSGNQGLAARAALEAYYLLGKYDEVLDTALKSPSPYERARDAFPANLASGDVVQAAQNLSLMGYDSYPFHSLALSVVFRMQGNAENAELWQQRAVERWSTGNHDERVLAAMFQKIPQVTFADVRDLAVADMQDKAVVLVALAQQCPAARDEMLDLAEKLNFMPGSPHPVLVQAIATLRESKD